MAGKERPQPLRGVSEDPQRVTRLWSEESGKREKKNGCSLGGVRPIGRIYSFTEPVGECPLNV